MTDSETVTFPDITTVPGAPPENRSTAGRLSGNTHDSHVLGTDAPATDTRPVGADDHAVIAVFPDLDAAQQAVERLAEAGFPPDHISIIGKDLQSETRINGFVTTGDIAGPAAATGAWVGGLFGLLGGTALLFIPGAGPLLVLGPLAAAAVGAAEGALFGGAVGATLGHFVAKEHLPKYERTIAAGSYLVVAHGLEDDVTRARQLLADAGAADVQRHDDHRGSVIDRIGPIEQVHEGMRVLDADGDKVGTVELVKMGDPEAVTTKGQDTGLGEPRLPPPFADRLLRIGFLKVDRTGLFTRDVYVAATEIDRVDNDTVVLSVPQQMLLAETAQPAVTGLPPSAR
jgi:hypothetical protein